jgi:hypothetical protein
MLLTIFAAYEIVITMLWLGFEPLTALHFCRVKQMPSYVASFAVLAIVLHRLRVALTTATPNECQAERRHVVVLLTQHHGGKDVVISQTLHAASKHRNRYLSELTIKPK